MNATLESLRVWKRAQESPVAKLVTKAATAASPAALLARDIALEEITIRHRGRIGWEAVTLPPSHDGQGGVLVAMLSTDVATLILRTDANGILRANGRPVTMSEAFMLLRRLR